MQLRESTILVQALYRGRCTRKMLPKFRKEKAAREVMPFLFSPLTFIIIYCNIN